MIINGDLESAQLEQFATVNLPTPILSKVVFDTTRNLALVGDGTKWLPLNGNTPSTVPAAFALDATVSNTFEKTITADAVFTFSNVPDGKSIVLVVLNSGGSDHTVTLPSAKWPSGNPQTDIVAGQRNLYSIVNVAGTYYINVIKDMA